MNPTSWYSISIRRGVRTVASVALALSLFTINAPIAAQGGTSDKHWVGTWATAVVARPQEQSELPQAPPQLDFSNQTLRQIVRVSLSGERIRVVLSNAFGTAPLKVGAAQIALRANDAAIVPESSRVLTFGGHQTTSIAAGSVVFSDPVDLALPALAELAIDLFLPGDTAASTSPLTTHTAAHQTNYVSTTGNYVGQSELPIETTALSWFFLSRVEVEAPEDVGAIVLLGDSITDGSGTTDDTNNRWPDHLARRLNEENIEMGVLNLGIGGNRLLMDGMGASALARFDRDVLIQSGATHLVVMEGINDIGMAQNEFGLPRPKRAPTTADLIGAHQQIIERARAQGLKVYGATLTPFEGTAFPSYWTSEGDETRKAFNEWIRTSQAYDAVIDFDAAMRDPDAPNKINPAYDSGDHLHPGDQGYEAMASFLDLELFKTRVDVAMAGR